MHLTRPFQLLGRTAALACLLLAGACQQQAQTTPTPPPNIPTASMPLVTPVPTAPASPPPATSGIPVPGTLTTGPDFSGQNAYEHVKALAEGIGVREAGTDGERRAADYIAGQFRSQGYTADILPASFEISDESASTLEVGGRRYDGNSLGFSASGDVSGPLVVVSGLGRAADYPAGAKGAVVLVERGTLPFSEKVANAAAAGAVAIIVYNNEAGEFRGTLGQAGKVPALGVSGDVGAQLKALAGQPVRVAVETRRRTVESRNVLARTGESCRVVVGGHFDSVPAGPGANDNASGTATTIELARVLRPLADQGRLCFMAFGAEELGLWGSRLWVRSLSDAEKQGITAMVNLDMVGLGDHWNIIGSLALVTQVGDIAKGLGIQVRLAPGGGSGGGGSDHASFMNAGIPAVFFYHGEDPNYHLPTDQARYVQPDALAEAGRMAAALIRQLANGG